MPILICPTHGRSGGVTTCLHVARAFDAGRPLPKTWRVSSEWIFPDDVSIALCRRCLTKFGLAARDASMNDDAERWNDICQAVQRFICGRCWRERRMRSVTRIALVSIPLLVGVHLLWLYLAGLPHGSNQNSPAAGIEALYSLLICLSFATLAYPFTLLQMRLARGWPLVGRALAFGAYVLLLALATLTLVVYVLTSVYRAH